MEMSKRKSSEKGEEMDCGAKVKGEIGDDGVFFMSILSKNWSLINPRVCR